MSSGMFENLSPFRVSDFAVFGCEGLFSKNFLNFSLKCNRIIRFPKLYLILSTETNVQKKFGKYPEKKVPHIDKR